jgi:hypothetical protein
LAAVRADQAASGAAREGTPPEADFRRNGRRRRLNPVQSREGGASGGVGPERAAER